MKSVLKLLSIFLLLLSCAFDSVTFVEAQTGVAISGHLAYKINVQTGAASATVEQLANYSMQNFESVRLVLVLSKTGYVEGQGMSGLEIASARLGSFPGRSFFSNLALSGQNQLPRVKNYKLVLAVVSGKTILNAVTFRNKISVASASVKRIITKSQETKEIRG